MVGLVRFRLRLRPAHQEVRPPNFTCRHPHILQSVPLPAQVSALRNLALRNLAKPATFTHMNPFIYGKIVEKKNFCPRQTLLQEMGSCIESGQNLVVFGRRRVGKSSLVLNASQQFPKRMLLLVDLFFTKDTAMFLEYCSNALFSFNHQRKGLLEKGMGALKRIRPHLEFDPNTGTPSFSFDVSQNNNDVLLHTVDDFFGFLGEEFHQDQLIVCFDEFQSVINYSECDTLLAKIRGKIQYHPFPYLFTGSDRNGLKTIFTNPQSPFYKSVRPLEIPGIPRKDFQPFLADKFSSGKRNISSDLWDKMFELEVPGDIQQLCAALWECSDAGDKIDLPILKEAYDRIFSQEIEGFRSLLGSLTALQLRVLNYIAKRGAKNLFSHESQKIIGAPGSSISRSLTALTSKWILVKDSADIYFNNPFLRQFLTRQSRN